MISDALHDALPGPYVSLAYLSVNAYASVLVFGEKTIYSLSAYQNQSLGQYPGIISFEMYVTNVFLPKCVMKYHYRNYYRETYNLTFKLGAIHKGCEMVFLFSSFYNTP